MPRDAKCSHGYCDELESSIYVLLCVYIYICILCTLFVSLLLSLSLCTHIWVNYYNLTVTSLGSWLVRGIIPKWPYFRRRVDNVPRAFVFFLNFVFNIFAVLFNFV